MKDTLVIMGSHPRTRAEFDFSRTDCDVWLFNEAISGHSDWAKRADAVFQMHAEAIWRNPANRNDPKHYEWLRTQTAIPVYMQKKYDDVPCSLTYPIDEIIQRFGIKHFTSSVAYALALAAYQNTYKRVEIYGVEMETNTEYQYQRDGVTLWLGVLAGLGVELDIHMSIFASKLYGYEGEAVLPYETFTKRISELLAKTETLDDEYGEASMKLHGIIKQFGERDNTPEISAAIQKQLELSKELGTLDGARQENERYKAKADTMKAASGGEFLFSRQEFESSAKRLSDEAAAAQAQVNTFSGQGELIHRSIINAARNSPKRGKLLEAYKQILQSYLRAHNQAMILAGAAQENFRYMSMLDKSIRAAGGAKSEAVLLEALTRQNEMVSEQ